jgi:outer membrane protein assembly factor BamB
LLFDDAVILEVGGKESKGFAAFNKRTGEKLWVKGLGKPSYCSPTVATIDGIAQIIFANDTMLLSFDITGNQLWSYRMPVQSPIAMPLFIAPNKFFVSFMSGSFLIKVEDNKVTEVCNKTSLNNFFSTSCHYNGYIYGVSNSALKCISATDGKLKWSEKGFGSGSLILVGNKLLVISDKGVLKLIEAIPDNYAEKGSFQAINGKSWTAPSFSSGNVYVRNLEEMASFKIKD